MAQMTSDATNGSDEPADTPGGSRAGWSAWAALLVVWIAWGSTYLAIRVADRSIPPFAMAAVRYLTAGTVLYPLAWLGSRRRTAPAPALGPAPGPAGGRAPSRLAQWGGVAGGGTLLLAFGHRGGAPWGETPPPRAGAPLGPTVPPWGGA